jgi:hypothetical protein
MTSSGLSLTLKDILLAQALLSLPSGGEDWMNICSRLCKQIMARLFSEGVFSAPEGFCATQVLKRWIRRPSLTVSLLTNSGTRS